MKEQEAGQTTAAVSRHHGIAESTFYKWKAGAFVCCALWMFGSCGGHRLARELNSLIEQNGKPQTIVSVCAADEKR